MESGQSLGQRWTAYRPSKVAWFWSCVACVVAAMILGFGWGGWVTGGTAARAAQEAATKARAELAATVCVDRFLRGADAGARLVSLKSTDSWKRDTFIEKGGWVTLGGTKEPVAGAADLCAERLMKADIPVVKTSG